MAQLLPEAAPRWPSLFRPSPALSSSSSRLLSTLGSDEKVQLNWASFGAGLAAGTARVLVGYPLDTLKVWRQTGQAELLPNGALARIFRLYRGCGAPLVTVGLNTSFAFTIYEVARAAANEVLVDRPLFCTFWAGTFSGMVLAVPTCPLANVQVLRQTSPSDRLHCATSQAEVDRRSALGWAKRLVAERGPTALFRGFGPHLIQAGFGRGFYMFGYELTKGLEDQVASSFPGVSQPSLTLPGKILAGSVAGISGWVFTYPFDVARANVIRDWRGERYSSALGAMRLLVREGGVQRLYAGLSWTVLRAVPVAAVTLPVYDLTQSWLLQAFRHRA